MDEIKKDDSRIKTLVIVCLSLAFAICVYNNYVLGDKLKELVHEQEVEFVEPDIFSNTLFPTCPDYTEPNEPEYINTTKFYTEEELEEIYKDEPALGKLAKALYGYEAESNEPEFEIVSFELADPNEPEFELTFCEATMSLPYKANLFDFIPTWPDYIELEKDLVIHRPGKTENEFIVMYFHKGTHIYFRDDDD